MLVVYFGLMTWLEGFAGALEQWNLYSTYIIALSVGFGGQMFLYRYLHDRQCQTDGAPVAASGISGGIAMVACCTHHLVDLVPFLGLAGVTTLLSSIQIQLFWIGIIFNLAGLIYLGGKAYRLA